MYDRIMIAIDATPSESNVTLSRAIIFAKRWESTVHLLHVARGHIVPGDITGGARLGVVVAEDDTEISERDVVQGAVNLLAAEGIEAHGELISATDHDIAETILRRAEELGVDLIVLGDEHHRGASRTFRSSVAEQVIKHHPQCSILLARPTVS